MVGTGTGHVGLMQRFYGHAGLMQRFYGHTGLMQRFYEGEWVRNLRQRGGLQ